MLTTTTQQPVRKITFGDMLAGGGGTSTGAYLVPGLNVLWAINHDPIAIATHKANHPETVHFVDDIRNPKLLDKLEAIDVLWASLECTQHSKAKGGQDKEVGSYMLGWEMLTYLIKLNPLAMIIENVPEFIKWGDIKNGKVVKKGSEYNRWVNTIKRLGYTNYKHVFLNAADYGAPTRRIRYIGYFCKPGINIPLPEQTHHEDASNLFGLPKWKPAKDYIDLEDEGVSIFGRTENLSIKPQFRKPLCKNTMKRIAGGIKKFSPEFDQFISTYFGSGVNAQSIEEPLNTIRTHDAAVLVTMEKMQFISDHCFVSNYDLLEDPLRTIMTRQTKEIVTVEKKFLDDQYGGRITAQSIDSPTTTITTANSKKLVSLHSQFIARWFSSDAANQSIQDPYPTITTSGADRMATLKAQFLSVSHNSSGHPEANNADLNRPCPSIATQEKIQFITAYFNASGHPETQNQSLDQPLNSITTGQNKQALVTALLNGEVDFDIKMRFLSADELSAIMTFPKGYFSKPGLRLSNKRKVKMIGNAVPPVFAKAILLPVVPVIEKYYAALAA